MKKTIITVGIIILVLIAVTISIFVIANRDEQIKNNEYIQEVTSEQSKTNAQEDETQPETEEFEERTQTPQAPAEEKVYVPTFMYFVSNQDEEETKETVESLKKEYEGRVTFDITNVDENPDAKKNFPVEGNTPMLIMLNTKNDISALAPNCSNYDELKSQIEKALITE